MPTDKPDNWDDLEEGSRKDAQIDQDTERHYIVDNGKKYWFDVVAPTWKKRNEVMSNALKISEDGADLRLDEYYLDMLEHMIADMSVGGDSIRMFLVGVNPSLGSKLEDIAPEPAETITEDEGNSSGGLSEADGQASNQTPD